jgi:hypothetical protein
MWQIIESIIKIMIFIIFVVSFCGTIWWVMVEIYNHTRKLIK